MVQAALMVLVLGGLADEVYLERRLAQLSAAYHEHANRQSAASLAVRGTIVREIGHLRTPSVCANAP